MSPSPELQFSLQSGCLVITATGRYLIENKDAAFRAIATILKDKAARAGLLDLRALKEPYTFMDRYQLGEMAARYLGAYPLAFLARPAQLDPGRIGLLVAKNRGAAKAEVFTDEAEAYAWLKQYQTG
jgi:hypothetical protein